MNIHLQFLKQETMRPVVVSLLLSGCLSATVISPTEASSDFPLDSTLFGALSTSVDFGNKGTTILFEELDVTITGVVRDQNQEPIPGVTVSVPGTGVGTATDMDGRYSIAVPEGSTLVFSFIGFNSHTVEVGTQTVIDVILMEDISSLEEVVVVGYAEQKKVSVTGAVASVNTQELRQSSSASLANALAGRLSGLRLSNPAAGSLAVMMPPCTSEVPPRPTAEVPSSSSTVCQGTISEPLTPMR